MEVQICSCCFLKCDLCKGYINKYHDNIFSIYEEMSEEQKKICRKCYENNKDEICQKCLEKYQILHFIASRCCNCEKQICSREKISEKNNSTYCLKCASKI